MNGQEIMLSPLGTKLHRGSLVFMQEYKGYVYIVERTRKRVWGGHRSWQYVWSKMPDKATPNVADRRNVDVIITVSKVPRDVFDAAMTHFDQFKEETP